MEIVRDLGEWLSQVLGDVPLSSEARAYVVSVLTRCEDMSDKMLSIEALEAQMNLDIPRLMKVGDWGVYKGTLDPKSLHEDGDFLLNISASSYTLVSRYTSGKWAIFDELAGKLESVAVNAHRAVMRCGLRIPIQVNSRPKPGLH